MNDMKRLSIVIFCFISHQVYGGEGYTFFDPFPEVRASQRDFSEVHDNLTFLERLQDELQDDLPQERRLALQSFKDRFPNYVPLEAYLLLEQKVTEQMSSLEEQELSAIKALWVSYPKAAPAFVFNSVVWSATEHIWHSAISCSLGEEYTVKGCSVFSATEAAMTINVATWVWTSGASASTVARVSLEELAAQKVGSMIRAAGTCVNPFLPRWIQSSENLRGLGNMAVNHVARIAVHMAVDSIANELLVDYSGSLDGVVIY